MARLVSRLTAVTLVALAACQGKSGATSEGEHGEAKAGAKAAAADAKGDDAAAHPLRADGPKVAFGELLVEGARNGNDLLQVIGTQAGKIQDCYAKTLEEHPDVAGQLGIRFFVAADGTVPDAILHTAKISDRSLQRCLMATFKTFEFPKLDGDPGTKATLPMVFGEVPSEAG